MTKELPRTIDDIYPDMPDPFSDDYVIAEVEWYGVTEPMILGDAEIKIDHPVGRLDNYFSVDFRVGDLMSPRLTIKGETWMSLTPMEIESSALPIYLAEGRVMTTGLGMGYYTLRVAGKPNVESVTVYEENEDVINAFIEIHKDKHPGLLDKITIVHNSFRDMKDQEFDFVFIDPYQSMLDEDVENDIRIVFDNNDIGMYYFWGMELAIVFAVNACVIQASAVPWPVKAFFRKWHDSEQGNMRMRSPPEEEYLQTLMDTMVEYAVLW